MEEKTIYRVIYDTDEKKDVIKTYEVTQEEIGAIIDGLVLKGYKNIQAVRKGYNYEE